MKSSKKLRKYCRSWIPKAALIIRIHNYMTIMNIGWMLGKTNYLLWKSTRISWKSLQTNLNWWEIKFNNENNYPEQPWWRLISLKNLKIRLKNNKFLHSKSQKYQKKSLKNTWKIIFKLVFLNFPLEDKTLHNSPKKNLKISKNSTWSSSSLNSVLTP